MPERYLVEAMERVEDRVLRAVTLAVAIAGVEGSGILLLTRTLADLHPWSMSQVLTPGERRRLIARETVEVRGVPLRHGSMGTPRAYGVADVLVVLKPDGAMLAMLDDLDDCRAVIVVPCPASEFEGWRRRWEPMVVHVDGGRPGLG